MISQKRSSFTMLLTLLTTCIATIAAQDHQYSPDAIVGGTPAVVRQFPHIVSLRTKNEHDCAGTIISDRWVLTAAHCTVGISPTSFQAGSIFQPSHHDEYKIVRSVRHPKYDKFLHAHDIALLKSSKSIKITKNVAYALLPKKNLDAGAKVSIAGWGCTKPTETCGSRKLLYFNASVVDRKECQKKLEGQQVVYKGDMCAFSRKNQGTCFGDSGGPLVDAQTRSVVYGIVSRGVPCAIGEPDVFVNVYAYIKWINSVIH